MSRLAPHVVFLMIVTMTACAQVDPVLMPMSMPECIYNGPTSMEEGNARVSLTLNGITDSGVVIAELTGEETHSDLADHFATSDNRWSQRPDWLATVLELRLDAGQGMEGKKETVALSAGSYVVICLDYPVDDTDPTAMVAAGLEVREA